MLFNGQQFEILQNGTNVNMKESNSLETTNMSLRDIPTENSGSWPPGDEYAFLV